MKYEIYVEGGRVAATDSYALAVIIAHQYAAADEVRIVNTYTGEDVTNCPDVSKWRENRA